jgi:hypothetical protein
MNRVMGQARRTRHMRPRQRSCSANQGDRRRQNECRRPLKFRALRHCVNVTERSIWWRWGESNRPIIGEICLVLQGSCRGGIGPIHQPVHQRCHRRTYFSGSVDCALTSCMICSNASTLPRASFTGLWSWGVTLNRFHDWVSLQFRCSPAQKSLMRRAE